MNNNVPLFQFQKLYYLLIVGVVSTVILLLSAVPNPSYAESGKRICLSANSQYAMKINAGISQKSACKSMVLANGDFYFGNGKYMTCNTYKKNFLSKNFKGDPCLQMKLVTRTSTKAFFRPTSGQVYSFSKFR